MPDPALTLNSDTLAEQVRAIAAGVFGVDQDEIPEDASTATYPLWTSLNHLTLMASVEEEFGRRLSMDEMKTMTSLDRIILFLGRAAAAA